MNYLMDKLAISEPRFICLFVFHPERNKWQLFLNNAWVCSPKFLCIYC